MNKSNHKTGRRRGKTESRSTMRLAMKMETARAIQKAAEAAGMELSEFAERALRASLDLISLLGGKGAGEPAPAPAVVAANEMVALPRELVNRLVDDARCFVEGYVIPDNWDSDNMARVIVNGLTVLSADDDDEFDKLVYEASNYVALKRALGEGEGLPDVEALVKFLKPQGGGKGGA
ncbi:MAG: hypothetical protein LBC18_14295 [Opitutaceae bacterium]|jgi:hypothetical protein|nr:hypothetical protein [Opitutaceae bacterium]